MAGLHIGTSGFNYADWRGVLYPRDLPSKDWLSAYAHVFDTVELNVTFYRLPGPHQAVTWAAQVPGRFHFAVKGSRYLTHLKRLLDTGRGIDRFFARIDGLGRKRGPVLWQLPPQMKPDYDRLADFLAALPAGKHAVEVRNPAWLDDRLLQVLHDAHAALVVHDLFEHPWPPPGPFVYVRFHGTTAPDHQRYGAHSLQRHARRFADEHRERWIYFNNDRGGAAVRDAFDLRRMLEGEEHVPRPHA